MDVNGNLLYYQEFCLEHHFNPSETDFAKLHKTLLKIFIFLIKNVVVHQL